MKINQLDLGVVPNSIIDNVAIFKMFSEATIIVKIVIVLLIVVSIVSWAIIFNKFWFFLRNNKKTTEFETKFYKNDNVKDFYHRMSLSSESPLATVFNNGFKRLETYINNSTNVKEGDYRLAIREACSTMQNTAEIEIRNMEKNLSILATSASASPFIGLFGTVWGIMTSFQAIASAKNTSIAIVAPGIAEALLVTAIGLFAAIPALIFYNKFSNEINNISGKMDSLVETTSIRFEKMIK